MNTLCVFTVGDRRVGVEMTSVREIIDAPTPTPIPLTPGFVRGLFNLRGEVLSLLDLESFVGATKRPELAADRALVVNHKSLRFAVPTREIRTLLPESLPSDLHPEAVVYPSLEIELHALEGNIHILNLDRLSASLGQAFHFTNLAEAAADPKRSL